MDGYRRRSTSILRRVQLRDQPVEAAATLRQSPNQSRGKRNEISSRRACARECRCRAPAAGARAKREELLGIGAEIDQIFAVIGRAGAERQNGEPVRAGGGLCLDITRIDGAQPVERRQLAPRPAMVTNNRLFSGCGSRRGGIFAFRAVLSAGFSSGRGGVSDGQSKARSRRSCCPGRRCTVSRIAAGGTSNSTPATVIGSDGASSAAVSFGQVGHST